MSQTERRPIHCLEHYQPHKSQALLLNLVCQKPIINTNGVDCTCERLNRGKSQSLGQGNRVYTDQ